MIPHNMTLFFVPRFRESTGTLNLIRPSVCQSVCLSVRLSVTKILTLAITFALLQVELWYLACVFIVTLPFRWYHVVTLTVTFDLLQGQICCQAGDHNSLNFSNLYVYSISFMARHFLLWKLAGAKFNFESMLQQERNLQGLYSCRKYLKCFCIL